MQKTEGKRRQTEAQTVWHVCVWIAMLPARSLAVLVSLSNFAVCLCVWWQAMLCASGHMCLCYSSAWVCMAAGWHTELAYCWQISAMDSLCFCIPACVFGSHSCLFKPLSHCLYLAILHSLRALTFLYTNVTESQWVFIHIYASRWWQLPVILSESLNEISDFLHQWEI